jgi:hypothetical protein
MKQFTLLSILALLMLSACAPSAEAIQTAIAQTQAAGGMSDKLTSRLNKLLEDGATLNAMAIQGTTFPEFRQQLAQAKGDYSLALSAQSSGSSIPPEAIEALNQAYTGWDLAQTVWYAKLNGGEAPHAPDAVRYAELVSYVGLEQLPVVGSGSESYVDPERVLRVLLSLATDHFMVAQDLLLDAMQ